MTFPVRESDLMTARELLYIDPDFPPDKTSLTYVYSGDDRYDRMTWHRPKGLVNHASFIGKGSKNDIFLRWYPIKECMWINYALAIVSLSARCMESLTNVVLTRAHKRASYADHAGTFLFNIWRFGEWVDVVVDDYLPNLDSNFPYVPPFGHSNEFWAPLAEKAYAKIYKTYEAIESGNMIDVLTDLTGAVCEMYHPDTDPPAMMFDILRQSRNHGSLIVCWRNGNLSQDNPSVLSTFTKLKSDMRRPDPQQCPRACYLVTDVHVIQLCAEKNIGAVSNEYLKLKCPYYEQFADDEIPEMTYLPVPPPLLDLLPSLEKGEMWVTYERFCSNFGTTVICSSIETLHTQSRNEADIQLNHLNTMSSVVQPVPVSTDCSFLQNRNGCIGGSQSNQRNVVESSESVGLCDFGIKPLYKCVSIHDPADDADISSVSSTGSTVMGRHLFRRHSFEIGRHSDKDAKSSILNKQNTNWLYPNIINPCMSMQNIGPRGMQSPFSMHSFKSLNDSCKSLSSISFTTVQEEHSSNTMRKVAWDAKQSTTEVSEMFSVHAMVNSHDVSPLIPWTSLLIVYGKWMKQDPVNADVNRRIFFVVPNSLPPTRESLMAKKYDQSKQHLLISVMQDYRNESPGTSVAGFAIKGFCVYKVRSKEKDVKKNLSKLTMVAQKESSSIMRELTGRVELLPGKYFIVPYIVNLSTDTKYLVRILH